ncbi:Fatty-acid amide hydrolase 1 [Orchesella cincta]|uniref:Fatty-acid amide hydrolase 1 n=1 Tax=Orchesella cincta TaxID=48709 RepID=A0A1D2MKL0_ORCCI|nr:Fatty-acid amide hydrolase 1 [Orchesella cincta]
MVNPELQAKIIHKQQERKESFAKLKAECILNERAINITQLSVEELARGLKSRELSATEVLKAYTAKALEVTEKFNCVTEFIPQALEWASKLDAIASNSNPIITGPLHGLPVAIKDDHDVEGMDTTMGFAKNLYKPVKESAVLVKILLKLGALPFVKTNVPQSIFSNGSDNPIFGTSLNCLNAKLSPAGSSSGGAVFATGSDLGGSLRTPAHFHGICSLRPTVNRLSEKGVVQCLPKVDGQRGVPGIIAANAKTLAFVWKAITENNIQNQFDPLAVPIPWNENIFSSKDQLKIGYFTSLPLFPAFEDTRKTVLAAKDAFASKGHKIMEFQMPDDFNYMNAIVNLLSSDRGQHLKQMFEGEPISYCVADLVESFRNPEQVEAKSSGTRREQILSYAARCGADVKTAGDLWDMIYEKRAITQDLLKRMDEAGLDLILSPAFPFPAIKLHDTHALLSGAVYTMIWSFVNFPAGVVRFGTESEAGFQSYDDGGHFEFKLAKAAMSESAGMPINVQIIGRPFKEELVLRAMLELETYKISS